MNENRLEETHLLEAISIILIIGIVIFNIITR